MITSPRIYIIVVLLNTITKCKIKGNYFEYDNTIFNLLLIVKLCGGDNPI